MSLCNEDEPLGTMSFVLENIHVDLVEDRLGIEEEVIEADDVKEPAYDMNFREKEITIGLLLETIDGMQNYIDELLGEIEKFNSGDKVRMAELEAKNEEYKAALVRMRNFVEEETVQEIEPEEQGIGGHSLLGRNGKILVLGASALDQNTMNGIAKLYGFHKKTMNMKLIIRRLLILPDVLTIAKDTQQSFSVLVLIKLQVLVIGQALLKSVDNVKICLVLMMQEVILVN